MGTKTTKMVQAAMITALIILLGLTPLGYPYIPPISLTIVMIPVAIGAIMLGPKYGAFLGLMFGLTSLVHAVLVPTPASPLFYNPLISVVPRIIVGIVPYYVYKVLPKGSKGKRSLASLVGGIAASVTNTILVLGFLFLFKGAATATAFGISQEGLAAALLAIASANGIPEAIVSGIVTSAIVTALLRKNKEA